MNSSNIIKGRDLMLFNNDGHAYAFATSHTFTLNAETSDISSKDHGIWGAVDVAKYTWEITSENLYTVADYDELFTAMVAGNPLTVRFGLKQTPADPTMTPADGNSALPYWTSQGSFYQGKAIITSLTTNANNGENATYSLTLTGTGTIKKVALSSYTTEGVTVTGTLNASGSKITYNGVEYDYVNSGDYKNDTAGEDCTVYVSGTKIKLHTYKNA